MRRLAPGLAIGAALLVPHTALARNCTVQPTTAGQISCLNSELSRLVRVTDDQAAEITSLGTDLATAEAELAAVTADYLTAGSLEGYATEDYVGEALAAINIAAYATQ